MSRSELATLCLDEVAREPFTVYSEQLAISGAQKRPRERHVSSTVAKHKTSKYRSCSHPFHFVSLRVHTLQRDCLSANVSRLILPRRHIAGFTATPARSSEVHLHAYLEHAAIHYLRWLQPVSV